MVERASRQGFYWSMTASDATQIMRSCKGCQYFVRQTHILAEELQTIPITWPFVIWGLDHLGPFKKVPRGLTHLLVTIDKFTKWIEARPLVKIGPKQAMDFIQDIIFALESLTPSSQIMALSSSRKNSWISMVTTTSRWIGLW
jgi:hypothetical protein